MLMIRHCGIDRLSGSRTCAGGEKRHNKGDSRAHWAHAFFRFWSANFGTSFCHSGGHQKAGGTPKIGEELDAFKSLWWDRDNPDWDPNIAQPDYNYRIWCRAYATVVIIRAEIALAGTDQTALRNVVREIRRYYDTNTKVSRFWKREYAQNGRKFNSRELVPGDRIWFKNTYF